MPAFLLGLDIGTSVTKAAIFDEGGREVAESARRTTILTPRPDWSEMDPESVWRSVCEACRSVLATAGLDGGDIAGVAVTGVMVGVWAVDRSGHALRPGILWNDGRARTLVERMLERDAALFSSVFARSGSVMQLGCTLPVLAWLVENEPDALRQAAAVFCAKDFIRFRLTGRIATDETEASVAPGSARGRKFDAALFELFGIGSVAHLLASVLRSDEVAGTITPEAARRTGLRVGTPVACGAGDTPASVLGAGAGQAGLACTVLGTTCLNGVVLDHPQFTPADLGLLFTVPGGLWMKTMVNVAGTTNIDWGLNALCPDLGATPDPYRALEQIAGTAAVGAAGVLYIPHLSPTGIIAPRIEPGARAGFVGLRPDHGRAEMVRALHEGVAFAIRDCYGAIGRPVERIRLVGGGSRSPFWSQMIADVTGIPVDVPTGTQFGAKGAALLAGIAIGWYASVGEACRRTFNLSRTHEPRSDTKAGYDASYKRYRVCCEAILDGVAPSYR